MGTTPRPLASLGATDKRAGETSTQCGDISHHHLVRFPNCHEYPEASGLGNLTMTYPPSPCQVPQLTWSGNLTTHLQPVVSFLFSSQQEVSYNIPGHLFRSDQSFFSQNRHRHASVTMQDNSIIIVGGFGSKFSGEIVPSRFSL